MRVLIFGSTGLLGLSFISRFYDDLDIIAVINNKNIKVDKVDTIKISLPLLNYDNLESIILDKRPEAVINAAAITSIEFCEDNQIETFNVNSKLANMISNICYKNNIKLAHISTDSLFKGDSEYAIEEADYMPQNIYAESKVQAEKLIIKKNPDALILRTSFYGWGPSSRQSLSDWIITSLRSKKEINCYNNIFFTPVFTIELSEVILALIKHKASGIYNISCREKISKYKFALDLANTLNLDKNLIHSIEYDNNINVQRPLDLSLSNSKLKKEQQIEISSVNNQLLQLKDNEKKIKEFYKIFSIN